MLNGNFLCLSCPSATFPLQQGDFVPREWAKEKTFNVLLLVAVQLCLTMSNYVGWGPFGVLKVYQTM